MISDTKPQYSEGLGALGIGPGALHDESDTIDVFGGVSGRPTMPLLPVIVSKMRHSDIEGVTRLEMRCQPVPWNANAYTTEMNNPNAFYVVAKTPEGLLAGYGGIWNVTDEIHVTTIGSSPSVRGRRVGERMLVALLREGIRRGGLRATLEVRRGNVVAQNLYRKYEFNDVSARKAYYSDNREDALIMWAEALTGDAYQLRLCEAERELFGRSPFFTH